MAAGHSATFASTCTLEVSEPLRQGKIYSTVGIPCEIADRNLYRYLFILVFHIGAMIAVYRIIERRWQGKASFRSR